MMINRAVLLLVALIGIPAVANPEAKYIDLTDQMTLVRIKPGETKEVMICWRNVPGGRDTDMALSATAELTGDERRKLRSVNTYESNGVAVTMDWKRSEELSKQLIEHDHAYWIVAAAKVAVGPKAKRGPLNVYVHYAAGTGRGVYRRGAICVLVASD
jgi:hypothetical protein